MTVNWDAFAIAVFGIIGALLLLAGVLLLSALIRAWLAQRDTWVDWIIVTGVLVAGVVLSAGAVGLAL